MKSSISPLLMFIVLCVVSCSFCKVRKNNYSYKLSVQLFKDDKIVSAIQWSNHLVFYSGYLFEFNLGIRDSESFYLKSGKHTIEKSLDTLGIFLLTPVGRKFFEFDTFAIDNKLIRHGNFSKKPFGQKMSDSTTTNSNYDKSQQLLDTIIWGYSLHYSKNVQKKHSGKDSIISFLYFLRKPNFLSLFEVANGAYYPDRNYSLVGFSILHIDSRELMICKLEELRVLTRKEELICADMIKKVKKIK